MAETEELKVRAEFPLWLQRQRELAGLSQRQLADLAGLASNMIGLLEKREHLLKHQPSADTCNAIARALKADPDLVLYLAKHRNIDPRKFGPAHPEVAQLLRRITVIDSMENEDELRRVTTLINNFLDALLNRD